MKKANLDKLDRVVIPKNICKDLNIGPGSTIVFDVNERGIYIFPEDVVCALCGKKIERHSEMRLCSDCIEKASIIFTHQKKDVVK